MTIKTSLLVTLVRHGQSVSNTAKRFGGHQDIPLSDIGRLLEGFASSLAQHASLWSDERPLRRPEPDQLDRVEGELRLAELRVPPRDTGNFTRDAMKGILADPKATRWQRISAALGLSWRQRVAAGRPLASSLEETGIFTSMITNMVRVGEESGQLSLVMEQMAPYYKERMETMIGRVTKLLEPVIIAGMGVTIAGLMLSIYLPMFEMAGNVK